jgi:NADPH:quinone reductase-like Zn-dependent oxidoreductase
MKVMASQSYGPLDQVRLTEIPEPTPGKGEVRVRVHASSVNPADYKTITGEAKILHGRNFPLVMGYDFAGVIDAVGEGVSDFRTGERVFGFLPYSGSNRQGAFGEKIVARTEAIAKIPDGVSFESAGASATAALTALQGLYPSREAISGKRVLVHGASGGVGSYAVQIARLWGAEVVATCSAGNAPFVKSLGASEVLDYRKVDVTQLQQKFAMLFDVAANLSYFKVRHLIQAGGRYVTLLPSASAIGGLLLRPVLSQKCAMVIVKSRPEHLTEVAGWLADGRVKSAIGQSYPLEKLPEALQCLKSGGVSGKLVIKIPPA